MSASTDAGLTRLARERGAVAWLEKPVDLAALRRLLNSLFPTDGPVTSRATLLCPWL